MAVVRHSHPALENKQGTPTKSRIIVTLLMAVCYFNAECCDYLYVAGMGPSAEYTETWQCSRTGLGLVEKNVPEWSSSTAGGVQGPLGHGPFCR